MLLLGSSFYKLPVLSLRTGTSVGRVVGHLINPYKLRVDALWVLIGGYRQPKLILVQDVREATPRGVVVDDVSVAVDPEEVVRLERLIAMNYELLDKKVLTGMIPLGKVADYALDRDSFLVQKIYASPNVFLKIKTSRLTYDRSQIVEVSNTYVKVSDSKHSKPNTLKQPRRQPQASLSTAASASLTEE